MEKGKELHDNQFMVEVGGGIRRILIVFVVFVFVAEDVMARLGFQRG